MGADGKNGNGISKVTLTEDFCLVFDYTDGTSSDKIGPIKGRDGENGKDGLTPILTLSDTGDLSVKYGESGEATPLGNIKGAKGDKGDKGDTGAKGSNGVDGKSAYELYIAAHPEYTGTQDEWLAALKGEKGDTGRGIAKTEIIDGYLWVTYTDNTKENVGLVGNSEDTSELIFVELSDGTYGVKAGEKAKNMAVITIPETYNGKAVTQICADAFRRLTTIQKIVLPEGIEVIGNNAFDSCTGLNDIVFPESLEQINQYAFNECTSLKTITIPVSVKFIGKYSFYNSGLSYATLKSNSDWKTGKIPVTKTGYGTTYSTMTDFRIEQKEGEWYRYNNFAYDLSDTEKAAAALSKKVENTSWLIMSYGGSTQVAYVTFEAYKYDWSHN